MSLWEFLYKVFSSVVQLCPTLCDLMDCSIPGFPVHHQLPEHGQIYVHRVGDAIQTSHPLLFPSLPVFNLLEHQGLFQRVSSLHQVAEVLALQLQHQFFWWIFRTDFLWDWLIWSPCSPRHSEESSRTPHFNTINPSVLSFFMVQLTSVHHTTGKTIALTRQTFVCKVMSLLFNMLSQFFKTFLPRSKCLLISWLQSPSCSDFGAQENKVCHCFHCFPIYLPWSDGTGCHDLSFLNVEF